MVFLEFARYGHYTHTHARAHTQVNKTVLKSSISLVGYYFTSNFGFLFQFILVLVYFTGVYIFILIAYFDAFFQYSKILYLTASQMFCCNLIMETCSTTGFVSHSKCD